MSHTLLRQLLHVERLKRECLSSIDTQAPLIDTTPINPFGSIDHYGWFESFLRQALNKVEATSDKWSTIAAVYNQVIGRIHFSNFVLGMLFDPFTKQEPVNLIRIDTFAYIMRHNRDNEDFLLEDLDLCSPVDLWLCIAEGGPSIPLWKAILFQYEFLEKTTGNLFLSLWTQDAVAYYIEQHYPDNPAAAGITGLTCKNEFIRATCNFKKLLTTKKGCHC